MKKLLFLLLALQVFARVFSQTEPVEPCCSIIAKDSKNNLLVARDNTTGQLYQFRADALDIKSVNIMDAVNISAGKITAINGAKRMYANVRKDPSEPCCSIVQIQADPAEPCCGIASIKNNSTGHSFNISIPKQIAATLKKGQAISMDATTGMAVVQSSYGSNNGQMNSFGYPATSGDDAISKTNETDKWVMKAIPTMKGVLGRLDINFPPDVERNILIYEPANNKFITSVSQNDKIYTIAPGEYRFTLTNVPVENVPIKKGQETRIRMGFLNVVSEGDWHLYDVEKKNAYTSGNKPTKLALPIGSYQVKLGLDFFPLTIKDGDTVEM